MIELAVGPARVRIQPERGGRIASIEVDTLELLLPESNDPMRWGCYPMAPWAGRVRNGVFQFDRKSFQLPVNLPPHAIHGTVFTRPWQLESDTSITTDLGPEWPFAGRARQRFALDSDGLDLTLELEAEGRPFPASMGWHPWFRRRLARGNSAELRFAARAMYARDAAGIPTGRLVPPPTGPWDDCFVDPAGSPTILWPGALALRLSASTNHWVVYDQPEHAICIEPQTGPPDALNLGPAIVAPGDPLVLTARLSWEIQSAAGPIR